LVWKLQGIHLVEPDVGMRTNLEVEQGQVVETLLFQKVKMW